VPDRALTAGTDAEILAIKTDTYRRVKHELRKIIVRLAGRGILRLPSEAELSSALGVSRATLRSALQSLQKEGRIRRLHGQGTFINRRAVGLQANLAEAGAFVDLLSDAGYQASVDIVTRRIEPVSPEIAESLEIREREPVLKIERVFRASGEPAVHSIDRFPSRLLDGDPMRLGPLSSTFEFVGQHIGSPVCYSVAEVRPVLPPPGIGEALEVAADHPLLRLRHTHVQADEQPVAATEAHVNDEFLRFSVIRTHLDE
jgi:GntR family transcriptional regulator